MEHQSGLFDGFEGYRSPTEEDLAEAIRTSLVVVDTNVLLNLYNFQGATLAGFIRVFRALGDRLFVPHQVIDEFWRNRREVLAANQGKHRERQEIEEAFESLNKLFTKWQRRVIDRSSGMPREVHKELEEARGEVLRYMDDNVKEAAPVLPDTPTHEDRVLAELEPLLQGRVGPPPPAEDLPSLERVGKERVDARVPPGYLDAHKDDRRAMGDFLVWHQTMQEAKLRAIPVLFVTQDQKEDWWADRGVRARPELVRELLQVAGQRLLMIRSFDLLRLASNVGVIVEQTAIVDAELVDEFVSGWNAEMITTYLQTLAIRRPQHFAILRQAAAEEGDISRAHVARHLGREEDAGMGGVTRPFITVARELFDEEPEAAMFAYYEHGGTMSHLCIPEDLKPMFRAGFAAFDHHEQAF